MIAIFVIKQEDGAVAVEVQHNYRIMSLTRIADGTGVEDIESTLLEKIEQALWDNDE